MASQPKAVRNPRNSKKTQDYGQLKNKITRNPRISKLLQLNRIPEVKSAEEIAVEAGLKAIVKVASLKNIEPQPGPRKRTVPLVFVRSRFERIYNAIITVENCLRLYPALHICLSPLRSINRAFKRQDMKITGTIGGPTIGASEFRFGFQNEPLDKKIFDKTFNEIRFLAHTIAKSKNLKGSLINIKFITKRVMDKYRSDNFKIILNV